MDAPSIVTCYISLLTLKIKVATVCALEFKWIFTGHLAGLVCGNCSESQNKCYWTTTRCL